MEEMATYGDRFAHVYDKIIPAVEHNGKEIAWLLSEIESNGTGASPQVLEIGVGTGRILHPLVAALSERGISTEFVVGVDNSAEMLRKVTERTPDYKINTVLADFSSRVDMAHFQDDTVDLALCVGATFVQLPSRTTQSNTLRELARVVRPGGKIIIEAHHPAVVEKMMAATDGKMFFPYPGDRTGLVWFGKIQGDFWNLDEIWIEAGVPHVLNEKALLTPPEVLEALAEPYGLVVDRITSGVGSNEELTSNDTMYSMILRKAT